MRILLFLFSMTFICSSCSENVPQPNSALDTASTSSFSLSDCKYISSRLGRRAISCGNHIIHMSGVNSTPADLLSKLRIINTAQNIKFRETKLKINNKTVKALYTWSGPKNEPLLSNYAVILGSINDDLTFLINCYREGGKIASKSYCEKVISEFVHRDGFKNWPSELSMQPDPGNWIIPIPFIKLRAPAPCGIVDPNNYQCDAGQVSWEVFDTLADANRMLESFIGSNPNMTVTIDKLPCTIGGVKTTCFSKLMTAKIIIQGYYAAISIGNHALFIACSVNLTSQKKAPGAVCGALMTFH